MKPWTTYVWRALTTAALVLAACPVSAQNWYDFGGTLVCEGHSVGNNTVKLACLQEVSRGNRLYTIHPSFTIKGPAASQYLGKHEGCVHVPASETRSNQDFVDCPGIPKWY